MRKACTSNSLAHRFARLLLSFGAVLGLGERVTATKPNRFKTPSRDLISRFEDRSLRLHGAIRLGDALVQTLPSTLRTILTAIVAALATTVTSHPFWTALAILMFVVLVIQVLAFQQAKKARERAERSRRSAAARGRKGPNRAPRSPTSRRKTKQASPSRRQVR